MTPPRGHAAPVSCAATSPDGRLHASGGYDRHILIWDAESGEVTGALSGHTSLVNGLAWSPDGRALASASSDYTARVWDVATGAERGRLAGHCDDVNTVCWSPDGHRLATASFDGTVRVWTRDGRCLLRAAHHGDDVNGVAWFPDGKRLAAASDDCTISIFDADTGRLRRSLTGHSDWVDQVAVHPRGHLLASASQDHTVGIWDTRTGARIATLDAASCVVKDVAWSPDGRELAAASYDAQVRVYDSEFRVVRSYRAEGLWNRTLDFGPRGLITGSFGGGPVLLADGEVRRLGPGTTPGLNGFAVTPDGERALVCCDDGCLYEVHLRRRRVLGAVGRHDAAVLCVACSPDGRYAVTGSWDRTVRVWDLRERSCVGFWEGLGDPINSVAFAGRSDRLWLGTFNGEVIQWDWRGGELERAGRHHGSVKLLSPGRRGVVSVGRDGSVRSWADGASSRFQAGETILNGVSVAEKSGRIATVSRRNGVEIWDDEGAPLARFDGHPCSAKTVHWSADEHSLAVGYYDGYVAVWQPEDDELRLERICDASVSQVRFVGDDLVVSAWDAEGSLYFVDPEAGGVRDVLPVGR